MRLSIACRNEADGGSLERPELSIECDGQVGAKNGCILGQCGAERGCGQQEDFQVKHYGSDSQLYSDACTLILEMLVH